MKMETTSNDQAEDLSERSESNNSCVTTSSNSNSSSCSGASETGFVDSADAYNSRADGPADLSLAQNKDYQRSDVFVESSSTEDPLSGSNLFRSKDTMLNQKESAMYTFCQIRQKSLHVALERSAAAAVAAGSGGKDLEFMKAYGLHGLDRVKDLTFSSRMTGIGLDRLRSGTMHETASSNIDPEDLKTLQQQQQQQQRTHHLDHPMSFERLRHAHPIFQEPGQFSHPQHQVPVHHLSHHHQHAITQLQHPSSQHQQHQHPQAKSFTIDAILGLRGGGAQRDKQRVHPYRKHQGQESTGKSLTTSSCSNGNGNSSTVSPAGSKLKRVRTIFTNEQLERLENEFARQQYMVGPERLYLAHALRLTEAQVKVWFQNRRIKWRKINHEKQSQRLHELKLNSPLLNSPLVNHQGGISERDDSNETAEW